MLAVLSELNCLKYIQDRGVYPDDFYTDFHDFSDKYVTFTDATVVVIISGNFRFGMQKCIELIKLMRAQTTMVGSGIREVYVLTDTKINNMDDYYMYDMNFSKFTHIKKMRKPEVVDVFALLRGKEDNKDGSCNLHFCAYDYEDATEAYEKLEKSTATDDEYFKLVQRPDVLKMLADSKVSA